jgi:hypothetical protein
MRQRWIGALAGAICVLVSLAAVVVIFDQDEQRQYYRFASAETRPELCMDSEARERVRSLMLEALDESLKTKIEELFAVWLRDATGQPGRAKKGMEAALLAYSHARNAAMQFNPPECPSG